MKKLATLSLVLLCACIGACGTLQRFTGRAGTLPIGASATTIPVMDPDKASGILAQLQRLVAFAREDAQNALDGATNAPVPDEVGRQCSMSTIILIDAVSIPRMKITGIASKAEALRLVQRALLMLAPKLTEVQDRCAAVYNIGALLRPIFALLGMARLLPI